MQQHEIANTKLILYLGIPALGWYCGAALIQIPLSPFPEATRAALDYTFQSIYLSGGLIVGAGLAWLSGWILDSYADDGFRGAAYRKVFRGTRMASWRVLRSMVRLANAAENRRRRKKKFKEKKLQPIMIGRMPMPLHLENRNTLICASIGAGKTVAMESIIASALRRRDKMVVIDPNGTFYSKFSFPGDIIINPFDQRSVGWSPFNEIKSLQDFDRMAKSIIPPQVGSEDEQWCSYARDVLADTMRKLMELNTPDMDRLVDILIREDGETIRKFLKNTDSQGYFRDNAEKAIAGVQFLMNKYVRPLRNMQPGDFSIHEWVHDPTAGNLFLTWREDMRASLRPLVAAWIDTICATILSFEPMTGKRLWMLLDELESLGKLESFVPAATKGRKHGLRMVGSIQDWSQLDTNYGKDAAATILSCFRNYVIFGASNALNADKASQILGNHEVERVRISYNVGRGRSRAFSHEREPVILDSEISNLKDLTGYIKFAEDFPIARITIPYVEYPERASAIEARVC